MATINLTLQVGQATTIVANFISSSTTIPPRQVVWHHENAQVLTIEPSTERGNFCTIGAKAEGTCRITCSSEGVVSDIIVTVTKEPIEDITFTVGAITSSI